jgi:hypothetical protein
MTVSIMNYIQHNDTDTFMLCVVMLCVIMLNVVAPVIKVQQLFLALVLLVNVAICQTPKKLPQLSSSIFFQQTLKPLT